MYYFRMNDPDTVTVTAWARLLRANTLAITRVEAALKAADLPSLEWYDVLLEVERAGSGGIRPFALEEKLLLPQYGISRLLERMARDGCIRRVPCAEDARGRVIVITPGGRRLRRRMWRVYGRIIEDTVGRHLDRTQRRDLSRLLEQFNKGLAGETAGS